MTYMLTEREPVWHPWLLEDLAIRFKLAADRWGTAIECCRAALAALDDLPLRADVEAWAADLDQIAARSRLYALHAEMTNVARLIR